MCKDILDNKKNIVMFGAGVIGQITTPEILKEYDVFQFIDCYIDNDERKWNSVIQINDQLLSINAPDYLAGCSENTVILVNISRYAEVLEQIEKMECTKNMLCYIMPMMCIHNLCKTKSDGNAILLNKAVIPKKIHYMWLGRKKIPYTLERCIESWRKYCSDYEIIEWNEDNYDLTRHLYMTQAYENVAYGFVPDYARIDILYQEGGIYMDTDVELIKNIDDMLYQEAFCGVEKWQVVNFGGCSGAVRGHPMLQKFLSMRKNIRFIDSKGNLNKNTCGFYDTQVILDEGYIMNGKTQYVNGINVYAYDYFHPYDYMSGESNITTHTYSIHHFNGGWLDDETKKTNIVTAQNFNRLYNECLS
jgi:hypothetical protein